MGIEPTSQAWEARILPMNYTRIGRSIIADPEAKSKGKFAGRRPPGIRFVFWAGEEKRKKKKHKNKVEILPGM